MSLNILVNTEKRVVRLMFNNGGEYAYYREKNRNGGTICINQVRNNLDIEIGRHYDFKFGKDYLDLRY